MKRISEVQAFFNKEYRDSEDGPFLMALQASFISHMRSKYSGVLPDHIYYADDCFVTYRNLGFLSDEEFSRACASAGFDSVLYGRIWRVWVVACTMLAAWKQSGTIADFGTYNGKVLCAALAYCTAKLGSRDDKVVAFDLFEDPPEEARKIEHGPKLFEQVSRRLAPLGDVQVVKGELPRSIKQKPIDAIVWAQIDLNSAQADLDTFKAIYPILLKGAVVIFDDYGFSRYSDTQCRLDEFLSADHRRVLELPTGQGLYIHT